MKNLNALKIIPFLALSWMMATPLNAQNTYALIVGISQYKEMPALQYADRDAIAFAAFVKGQGTPDQNIKLFLNEEASRLNIVDELYKLSQMAKPQDLFYFYFGGHGDLEANVSNENTLLLLHDAPIKSYFKGDAFLQVSELKNWLSALSKKQVQVVFIADACHSGGLIGGNEGQVRTQQVLEENWGNVTKILSSQANELSLEGQQWGGGRGLFSFHLVNGLIGKADADQNKLVSLEELNTYLLSNVTKEASPNLQTPLVIGEKKFLLAKVNPEALKKLIDAERLSFPIISSANFKANIDDLLAQLDASLVTTYKKFAQALKDKRINIFDDETDYALLHFQILANANVPEHLLQIMKRNLAAGLMERELEIMKATRESGFGYVPNNANLINPAINNLKEIINLFGADHYLFPLLQARTLALESNLIFVLPSASASTDQTIQAIKDANFKKKELLWASLQLEQKMISTYALLGTIYRENQQPDSSLYYQEKVLELIPNESRLHYYLGSTYLSLEYKDSSQQIVPHPKAIYHLEKALALNPNVYFYLKSLRDLYAGLHFPNYANYTKAIYYCEKHLSAVKTAHLDLIKGPISYPQEGSYYFEGASSGMALNIYSSQVATYALLYLCHKKMGNIPAAEANMLRFKQITDSVGTVFAYMTAAVLMYQLADHDQIKFYQEYLGMAESFQQKALAKAEQDLANITPGQKLEAMIVYRELLKAVGVTKRLLKNYAEAETFLLKALAYPVNAPTGGHFKMMGSYGGFDHKLGLEVTVPLGIVKIRDSDYHYRVDANWELCFLYWEQGKAKEAFVWLEKAFQNAVAESGNDISGQATEDGVLRDYPEAFKTRFKTLKAKYFPPTNPDKK